LAAIFPNALTIGGNRIDSTDCGLSDGCPELRQNLHVEIYWFLSVSLLIVCLSCSEVQPRFLSFPFLLLGAALFISNNQANDSIHTYTLPEISVSGEAISSCPGVQWIAVAQAIGELDGSWYIPAPLPAFRLC
jgi:hypothetical protein